MRINCNGAMHCNFTMGKARVNPKKHIYIPSLELVAVTLSEKMVKFFRKEFNIVCLQETFWSDSKVVLWYIRNVATKFKVFVTNRIQQLHESSEVNQWRYVPSKDNPADHAFWGFIYASSRKKCSNWLEGLQFLWEPEHTWPVEKDVQMVSDTDVKVKYYLKVNLVSSSINLY